MANSKPIIYSDYSDSPEFLKEFLYYMQTIKGLSPRTVEAYYLDLTLFLKYILQKRSGSINNEILNEQCSLEFYSNSFSSICIYGLDEKENKKVLFAFETA